METQPKYFKLPPHWMGHMGAAKKVVIVIAGYAALTNYPWATPLILAIREVLSWYESVSEVEQPVKIDE